VGGVPPQQTRSFRYWPRMTVEGYFKIKLETWVWFFMWVANKSKIFLLFGGKQTSDVFLFVLGVL